MFLPAFFCLRIHEEECTKKETERERVRKKGGRGKRAKLSRRGRGRERESKRTRATTFQQFINAKGLGYFGLKIYIYLLKGFWNLFYTHIYTQRGGGCCILVCKG